MPTAAITGAALQALADEDLREVALPTMAWLSLLTGVVVFGVMCLYHLRQNQPPKRRR